MGSQSVGHDLATQQRESQDQESWGLGSRCAFEQSVCVSGAGVRTQSLPLGRCVLEVKLKGAETLHLFPPSVCTSIITPQRCSTGGHHALLNEHCVETFLASQLGEGCKWYPTGGGQGFCWTAHSVEEGHLSPARLVCFKWCVCLGGRGRSSYNFVQRFIYRDVYCSIVYGVKKLNKLHVQQ